MSYLPDNRHVYATFEREALRVVDGGRAHPAHAVLIGFREAKATRRRTRSASMECST